jgi:hypothetical protein
MATKARHSEAYEAGRRSLAAAAARLGTVNLSPSTAMREDWGYRWSDFMKGWNAEKRSGQFNPGRKRGRRMTKTQRRANAAKRAKKSRVARALQKFLASVAPAKKYSGAEMRKNPGGSITIKPLKAVRRRR